MVQVNFCIQKSTVLYSEFCSNFFHGTQNFLNQRYINWFYNLHYKKAKIILQIIKSGRWQAATTPEYGYNWDIHLIPPNNYPMGMGYFAPQVGGLSLMGVLDGHMTPIYSPNGSRNDPNTPF